MEITAIYSQILMVVLISYQYATDNTFIWIRRNASSNILAKDEAKTICEQRLECLCITDQPLLQRWKCNVTLFAVAMRIFYFI
jgi:hypothetical protein